MGTASIINLVILGLVVLLIFWVIGIYNRLVRLKNEIENAWAQIDVQLKRRHDLIPNLVETVKGYATHERETLQRVIEARNMAVGAGSIPEKANAEGALSGALKSLFAVSEAYPDLKANTNFMALHEELASTENKIAFARQFYNDRTLFYNTRIETVPDNIIAGMFHFTRRDYFEVPDEAARSAPKVTF